METLHDIYVIFKNIIGWIFVALVGVITWFFREKLGQHKEMYDFYAQSKILHEEQAQKLQKLDDLKQKLESVESDSKRYWKEHELKMETNQKIILEKIESLIKIHQEQITSIKSAQTDIKEDIKEIKQKL